MTQVTVVVPFDEYNAMRDRANSMAKLEGELRMLQARNANQRGMLEAQGEEIRKLALDRDAHAEKVKALGRQVEQLKLGRGHYDRQLLDNRNLNDRLREEVEGLKKNIEHYKNGTASLHDQLKRAHADHAKTLKRVDRMQAHIGRLRVKGECWDKVANAYYIGDEMRYTFDLDRVIDGIRAAIATADALDRLEIRKADITDYGSQGGDFTIKGKGPDFSVEKRLNADLTATEIQARNARAKERDGCSPLVYQGINLSYDEVMPTSRYSEAGHDEVLRDAVAEEIGQDVPEDTIAQTGSKAPVSVITNQRGENALLVRPPHGWQLVREAVMEERRRGPRRQGNDQNITAALRRKSIGRRKDDLTF